MEYKSAPGPATTIPRLYNNTGDPLRVHNLFVHNFVFFVSSWLNLFLTQGKLIRYGAIEYKSAPGPATTIPRLYNNTGDPLRVHNLFVHNFVFFVSSWFNPFLTQGKPIRYSAMEYKSASGPATTIPRLFFFEKKKQKTFTLLGRALSD